MGYSNQRAETTLVRSEILLVVLFNIATTFSIEYLLFFLGYASSKTSVETAFRFFK